VKSVVAVMHGNTDKARRLAARLVRDFPAERDACPVGSYDALEHAIMTAPAARDPALLAKLGAVAGRVLRR
jgi:5'-methylthioadenosine phosphorylase